MMMFLYTILLILFSVYSYGLIDVNITLFNNRYWEIFRGQMVNFGYLHRDLSSAGYLIFIILFFLFNLYFVRNYKKLNLFKITFIIGGILLFSYPFLSHDLFNYIFDAKIVTFYHKIPYFFRAQDFPDDPWLRFMHWTHRKYPYGPTFLLITLAPSLLALNKFVLNFFFFKLMFIVFYAAACYSLNKMNRKWAVIFATHPLVIVEGLVSVHNDLIMVSLAIIGLYLLIKKKKEIFARIMLTSSFGIKYITLPLVFISSNKKLNYGLFLIFSLVMIYLSFTREIQPWYFLSFFAFLPFLGERLTRFNFTALGLLASHYFFVRYGVLNETWQRAMKNEIIFVFFILNFVYLFWKNKTILTFFILVTAFISRFLLISKTAFFVNDQGRDIAVLYNMAFNKIFTLIGPATSIAGNFGNLYFGAYYYYFLLPFYTISKSPYFMTIVVPIVFLAGLVIFSKIKELNLWEKIFFLFLVTSSWYSLFYTRFLWNLNLAFSLSFVLFFLFLIFKDKIRSSAFLVLVFGFFSGAIFQIHYGMLFLYVSLLIFFWKKKQNILLYLFGFLLSFFPFVLFDLRHEGVIIKNLLSFFALRHPSGDLTSLALVFGKIFDYYLLPFITLPLILKIGITLLLYLGTIIYLFRKKTELSRFLLIAYLIFPLTFFLFKRDFDYYLACFFIWYYLGLALLLYALFKRRGVMMYFSLLFILIFFILNLIKYFSLSANSYSLETQNNLAGSIAGYDTQWYEAEQKKGHRVKNPHHLRLNVYPHQDDIAGVAYVLKTEYDLLLTSDINIGKEYFICYLNNCPSQAKNPNEVILLYDQNNVKVYVFR